MNQKHILIIIGIVIGIVYLSSPIQDANRQAITTPYIVIKSITFDPEVKQGETVSIKVAFANDGVETGSINAEALIIADQFSNQFGLQSIVAKRNTCTKETFNEAFAMELAPSEKTTITFHIPAPDKNTRFENGDINYNDKGMYNVIVGEYIQCGEYTNHANLRTKGLVWDSKPIKITETATTSEEEEVTQDPSFEEFEKKWDAVVSYFKNLRGPMLILWGIVAIMILASIAGWKDKR